MSGTPVLRVVRGDATPEELAAVVALLSRAGFSVAEPEAAPPSRWNDRATALRRPLHPGPGAWRAGL